MIFRADSFKIVLTIAAAAFSPHQLFCIREGPFERAFPPIESIVNTARVIVKFPWNNAREAREPRENVHFILAFPVRRTREFISVSSNNFQFV